MSKVISKILKAAPFGNAETGQLMAMSRSKSIEFFAPSKSSWIETDFQMLSKLADVRFNNVTTGSFWRWLLKWRRYDIGYFWFGSFRHLPYLAITKLLGKQIIIVAAGYDVNGIPEIKYGAFEEGALRRSLRRFVFSFADRILAVSKFTEALALKNLGRSPQYIETVYLPVAIPETPPAPWTNRQHQVVFLLSSDEKNRLVKGVDRIPEICRRLPSVRFKLAGELSESVRDFIEKEHLSNLELLGALPFHSLSFFELLNSSRIICGPSRGESFGVALLDGALMGCYPVAFDVGSIREILDDIGTLVEPGDCDAMAKAIQIALNFPESPLTHAADKIRSRFSPEVRERRLRTLLGVADDRN